MKSTKTSRTLCLALACAAFTFSLAVSVQAQTVTYLAHFNRVNGNGPSGPVVQASDGNFYGTTEHGGVNAQGNVFRMTPSGKITSIYSFCSKANCADGGLVAACSGPVCQPYLLLLYLSRYAADLSIPDVVGLPGFHRWRDS